MLNHRRKTEAFCECSDQEIYVHCYVATYEKYNTYVIHVG